MEKSLNYKAGIILTILNNSSNISESEISEKTKLSIDEVKDGIKELQRQGFGISKVSNTGWQIKPYDDCLCAPSIYSYLYNQKPVPNVLYFSEMDSTNSRAKELAVPGFDSPTLIVTDFQTSGRGRLNRTWESSPGKNILFSILIRPRITFDHIGRIPIGVVTSLSRTIKEFTGLDVMVRWPNDLMINHKKFGGILIESGVQKKNLDYVIIGVGINVNDDLSGASDLVKEMGTSLSLIMNKKIPRLPLFVSMVEGVMELFRGILKDNFENIITDWRNLSETLGKHVRIEMEHEVLEGYVIDLDDEGGLIIDQSRGGYRHITVGDVTRLRLD